MYEFLIIIQIISILAMFVVEYYIIKYWANRAHSYFFIVTTSAIVNNVGYLLEMLGTNGDACYHATVFAYLGKPFIPVAMLMFAARFCKVKIPKIVKGILYILSLVFFALVVTSDMNGWFYVSREFVTDSGFFPHNVYKHGPLYFVFLAETLACIVAMLVIVIGKYKKTKLRKARKQLLSIIAMAAVEFVGLILFLLRVTGGYDTTSVALLVCAVIFCISVVRFNIFEDVEVVKQALFEDLDEIIIAFHDADDEIFYYNDCAKRVFPELESDKIRKLSDFAKDIKTKKTLFKGEGIYEVSVKPIFVKERPVGEVLILKDITETYKMNVSLQFQVNRTKEDIARMQKSVIVGLADMVEARDGFTGAHIRNTSEYVKVIVDALGKEIKYKDILTPEYSKMLVDAAPLHDIGKISVPDSILGKKGRLSDDEFEIIKKHTVNGANIIDQTLKDVESAEYLKLAHEIALFHHEKWDGSGYPNGISGEDIPLSARIMAVADVYDALTSKRSYKDAYSFEKARDIMTSGKDQHFDGYLVDTFFNNLVILN